MMRALVALVIACAACSTSVPPPISEGKCLVDEFAGARAEKQTCIYAGYTWRCAWSSNHNTCTRGGEASGERTK